MGWCSYTQGIGSINLRGSLSRFLGPQAEDWASADRYASRALESMTLLIGIRAHPVLESFYQAACRAKTNNGGQGGSGGWKSCRGMRQGSCWVLGGAL